MRDYFRKDKKVRFIFPIDGDCINENDGEKTENGVIVLTKIAAPKDAEICVNDQKAVFDGECFVAKIEYKSFRTSLTAVDQKSGESDTIAVYKLKDVVKKFRLTSDDNILFLRDINDHKDEYTSLFDNPYLKMYKRAHDATGVCVHLNLFFRTGDDETKEDYFDLTMMTDKFKDEWKANADWLHLSFHSYSNEPLWPYKNTTHTQITEECEKVHKEILRFAGEDTLPKETTIHFGAINETGLRAVRTLGYKILAGYFEQDKEGNPLVSYFYPLDLIHHVGERDFWKDTVEDMFYCRIDRVLNLAKTVEENLKFVKDAMESKTRGGFVELMIHEQYFYPDYYAYIPAFGDIIYESCKLLKDNGYTSTFVCKVIEE